MYLYLSATYPAIGLATIPTLESIELPKLQAAYTPPAAAKFDVGSSLNVNITLEFCAAMERILGEPVQIDIMDCGECIASARGRTVATFPNALFEWKSTCW